jgi:hypothetical protein
MTQINNNIGNISGVDGNSSKKDIPTTAAKVAAPGSGNSGTGASPSIGQALINGAQDVELSNSLAKANSAPSREGLSALALKVIFGDKAATAAQTLLPSRASVFEQAVLAGALTSENYQQAA